VGHFTQEAVTIILALIFLLMSILAVKYWGSELSRLYSYGSTEVMTEHISAFLTMSSIAPKYFVNVEKFPDNLNHTIKINDKVGSNANVTVFIIPHRTSGSARIYFRKWKLFPYFIPDSSINVSGCVPECQMNGRTVLVINKTGSSVKVNFR